MAACGARLEASGGEAVTLRPRPGNAAPRLCETVAGLINSIGLENKGIEHYLAFIAPEGEALKQVQDRKPKELVEARLERLMGHGKFKEASER